MVGDDARRDRPRPRHPLVQHLRPVRGHRPGRCQRVRRGAQRPARPRGSLPARGRRSRQRRAARRGRGGRARVHGAHQTGAAADALLDGRSRQPLDGAVQLRAHAHQDERDQGPYRRHADHPRRQRLPDPGRRGHRPRARALSPLPAGRQPGRDDGRGRGAQRGDRRALPRRRGRAALGRGDRGRSHAARRARAPRRSDQGHDRVLDEGQSGRPGTLPRSEGGKLPRVLDKRPREQA